MPSILKKFMLSEYEQRFDKINSMIFFDYQGIAAIDFVAFKNQLAEEGIKVVVIRNRIFIKLMKKRNITGLDDILRGPVAVAYGVEEGDVIKAAKALTKFNKTKKKGEIIGGIIDGEVDDADGAKKYTDLLSREELLSIISGQILAMGSKIAGCLVGPSSMLASQIEKKSKEEE